MTESNAELLTRLKGDFEARACSRPRYEWYKRARDDYGCYEGTLQWSPEDREAIKTETGIDPVTNNRLKPRIDNVAGLEIQSRTKVVYTARSSNPVDVAVAEALSHIALWIEDRNDSTHILSKVSQDGYKGGIGVHCFDFQGSAIVERVVSPFNYVWDVFDRSDDLSRQRCGSEIEWVRRDDLKRRYKSKGDDIDGVVAGGSSFAVKPYAKDGERLATTGGYYDKKADEILVVTHQYAEPATYYSVLTKRDDRDVILQTFDKEVAKRAGGTIEEREGWRVFKAVFTADLLLENGPHPLQLDAASGQILYTPFVHCMTSPAAEIPGVPYSNLCMAKDAQRLYNKSRTRLSWLTSSRQVIMESGAAEAEKVRSEAARADGVLVVAPGKKLEIHDHAQRIAQEQANATGFDMDIQAALGIFDESLGIETNASAGVAIERRQLGSDRNQALFLDRFRAMKKRWAFKLLRLIQSAVTEAQIFYVTDDEGMTKAVGINGENGTLVDANNKDIAAPDIKVGAFDVTIQEVPDYNTMKDISRENILKAAQAVGGFQNLTPDILKFFGVPPSDEMVKASSEKLHAQTVAANEQAMTAAKIGGGVVPTTTPANGAPIPGGQG